MSRLREDQRVNSGRLWTRLPVHMIWAYDYNANVGRIFFTANVVAGFISLPKLAGLSILPTV